MKTGLKGVILLVACAPIMIMDKLFAVDMLFSPGHIAWIGEPNLTVLIIETGMLLVLTVAQVVIAIELILAAPAVQRFLGRFKRR